MSELLNLPRMANRLGVPRAWLRAEAESGAIPAVKAGRQYLFSPEAVVEILAARAGGTACQKREATSQAEMEKATTNEHN